ncbi:MAG: hypothetical protein NTY16_10935 [Deltaproteobacteria bacterium]|nr:hypothetical protein [Deltaproteobacteria bacterium]
MNDADSHIMSEDEKRIVIHPWSKAERLIISNLQGAASAIIYDGIVTDDEINFLVDWLEDNRKYQDTWPISTLIKTIRNVLADNIIDDNERHLLLTFLKSIVNYYDDTGNAPKITFTGKAEETIYDANVQITFYKKTFVFTGAMQFGKRNKAEFEVMKRGGDCLGKFTPNCDYVVVGSLGSREWAFGNYGHKIAQAIQTRNEGRSKAKIVREVDFTRAIINTKP